MTRASLKSLGPAFKNPRGRPRDEALQERRREQILEKATRVFAEHGYPNTDVQFIADPLGISKGTVYRYFPSKEQLFLAAVERGVRQLNETMERATAHPDGVHVLVEATRAYLEFFESHPDLVELFVQERAEFRGRRKPIYFERGCDEECGFRTMLEGLIAEGRLRPDIPVARVMTVIRDLVYGTIITNHFAGRRKPFGEQAADIIDVVFNGILTEGERARLKTLAGDRQKTA
jgi:AcrR family transcriptional regulator